MATPRHRGRLLVYIISFLVFSGAVTAALLLSRGYTFDFAAGLQENGILLLASQPDEATVAINGEERGDRTTASFKLPAGSYGVRVEKPGTVTWEEQLSISPGQAELREDIILFYQEPAVTTIVPSGAVAPAVAPNGQTVAFVRPAPGGATPSSQVASVELESPQTVTPLGVLPASLGQPEQLVFSRDSSQVAVLTASGVAVADRREGGTVVAIAAPGIEEAAFVPDDASQLLLRRGGDVFVQPIPADDSGAASTNQAAALLIRGVTALAVTDQAVYLATEGAQLIRRDGQLANPEPVPLEGPAVSLVTANGADVVVARNAAGALSRLDLGNQTADERVRTIDTGVKTMALSSDGQTIAYTKGPELRQWRAATVEAAAGSRLVTRFSIAPKELATLGGEAYVLYVQDGTVHAITAGGGNDYALAELPGPLFGGTGNQLVVSDPTTGRLAAVELFESSFFGF